MLQLKNILLPLAGFTLTADVELRGGITALFGPSGAGKTSLLDLLAGLRRPHTAFIRLDDRVLTDTKNNCCVPTARRGIGYVPQDLALFPHLSVRQNLLYGRSSGDRSSITLDHAAEILELQPLVTRPVSALSGGEKQRVALGRALLAAPRLLLLDEPLASLDAPLKAKIIPYLTRIRDEFKIPMLYVTHDREEALALADEIVVLDRGTILQAGPVLEVFNRPANPDVARLVGMETFQPGTITETHDGLATVAVGNTSLTALAPGIAARHVFICIRGEDVVLQRDFTGTSSVRNRLSARVAGLRPEGSMLRVELDAGFPLFALITRPAGIELDLHEGEFVTAFIKTPAIHLVPRGHCC